MSRLRPVAFDIETGGFEPTAPLTVVGLAADGGAWQGLNTAGQPVPERALQTTLRERTGRAVDIAVTTDEPALIEALARVATERLDGDRHYLCAFNGDTWRGGFDLPFLRTACARHGVDWPFPSMAYADVQAMVKRFNTGDVGDLVGVYDALIGGDRDDPFEDSAEAITALETGDWRRLLQHNLADIVRTHELATLAGRYVPRSDFRMKNLEPPD